ncbi:hypothetical protein H2203_000950 [Taxawa tesnikishii (nom. ined.)]|nr:hypothetical protein H2203_000950 [Dothideales sp. JES 119]
MEVVCAPAKATLLDTWDAVVILPLEEELLGATGAVAASETLELETLEDGATGEGRALTDELWTKELAPTSEFERARVLEDAELLCTRPGVSVTTLAGTVVDCCAATVVWLSVVDEVEAAGIWVLELDMADMLTLTEAILLLDLIEVTAREETPPETVLDASGARESPLTTLPGARVMPAVDD